MTETELIEHLSQYDDWALDDAEDGDIGYYAWCDGGYLGNCYQKSQEALEAILHYFEGDGQ